VIVSSNFRNEKKEEGKKEQKTAHRNITHTGAQNPYKSQYKGSYIYIFNIS
jgi:hypothetical protein